MTVPASTKWGDKKNRRLDILAAARGQLEVNGYHGLNIRQVASAAHVSPGLVYSYFANKEELFATLYAERLQLLQLEIEASCQHTTDFNQFFINLLNAYLPVYQHFGKEFNLFSLLRQPDQFPAELTQQLTDTAIQLMTTLYGYSQKLLGTENLGLTTMPNAQLILPMFWITLNGLADHFSGDRQHVYGHDLETMSRFMSNTLLLGLQYPALSSSISARPPQQNKE